MNKIAKMTKIRAWADQVEEWRRSGITQAAWARAHGMSRDTFKYRKRQVEEYALSIMKGEQEIPACVLKRTESEVTHVIQQEDIVPFPEDTVSTELVRLPLQSFNKENDEAKYTIEICLSTCTVRATNDASDYLLRSVLKELRYA